MPEKTEQKRLRVLLEGFDKGWLKYESKDSKSVDWASYTEAQIHEVKNFLLLVREVVSDATHYVYDREGPGRPSKSAEDKAKAILVQQFFQCSNRVAEGLVDLFREKLRLTENLTYKDIERAYEDPQVLLILHKAFELTNEPVADKETDFAGDGTGQPTSIKQNYANDRDDAKKHKGYEKAILVVGRKYKMVATCEIADGTAHESPYIIPLLEQVTELYERLGIVDLDSAYLSRDVCDWIVAHGGTPRIYSKSNTVINARGSRAWAEMLMAFIDDPQKWLEEYHPRSIAESTNSVLKRRLPRPLLKVVKVRRKAEAFSRIVAYNTGRSFDLPCSRSSLLLASAS
jgi:transposase